MPLHSSKQLFVDNAPQVTAEDVLRIIDRDFPHDQSAVSGLLEHFAAIDASNARVHLAILKLSQGKLDNVRQYAEIAKQDFRDVLCPAEYPRQSRSSQLPLADRENAKREDFREYEIWLGRRNA